MDERDDRWENERQKLLGRRISELGLRIAGSPVERLVEQLYGELEAKRMPLRPPVYLSDEWGCPEGRPLIGVPFYLADRRLSRIEAEQMNGVEDEEESMRYLRHEAGHAVNYAYRLYDRADWRQTFGPYTRPYRERYHADPFSRDYVRHILGWYAQKHPDEDFAETFAVWMTPGLDWRAVYEGWPAVKKLEYVDALMTEIGTAAPEPVDAPRPEDLPVEAMHYTVAQHYQEIAGVLPIEDERYFDGDLRNIFVSSSKAPDGSPASEFLKAHLREIVGRISYWTGETPTIVRGFIEFIARRAEVLDLRVHGLEASTLIELTAFGTAVMMNHRYTDALEGDTRGGAI